MSYIYIISYPNLVLLYNIILQIANFQKELNIHASVYSLESHHLFGLGGFQLLVT